MRKNLFEVRLRCLSSAFGTCYILSHASRDARGIIGRVPQTRPESHAPQTGGREAQELDLALPLAGRDTSAPTLHALASRDKGSWFWAAPIILFRSIAPHSSS